jgi:hypothetical protein
LRGDLVLVFFLNALLPAAGTFVEKSCFLSLNQYNQKASLAGSRVREFFCGLAPSKGKHFLNPIYKKGIYES